MSEKSSLRKAFLELLKQQGSKERQKKSLEIAKKLFELAAFQSAQCVLFYASLPGEVETSTMINRTIQLKKSVALPHIARHQREMIPILIDSLSGLSQGDYGMPEPTWDAAKIMDRDNINAVIVPGVAFDKANNRLGRGGGYYDRFLSGLPSATVKIGIAFDFQIVDSLPTERHDVPLDIVIVG